MGADRRHRPARYFGWALWLVVVCLLAGRPSLAQAPDAEIAPPVDLAEGVTRSASQRAHESVTYLFNARADRTYLIDVDQHGLDLIVTVQSPDGTSRSYNSPLSRDERELVLLENVAAGVYSITVHSEEHTGAIGGHSIQVSAQSDATRIAAWRLMSHGASLNFDGGERAWAQAIEAYEQAARLWAELEATAEQAYATFAVAMLEYWRAYDRQRSDQLSKRAAELYERIGDAALGASAAYLQASSLIELAGSAPEPQAVFDQALALFEQTAAVQQQLGRLHDFAYTMNNTGFTHYYMGDWPRAREYWEQSASLFRNIDEWSGELLALHNLAAIDAEEGYLANAADVLQRVLDLHPPRRNHRQRTDTLANLGVVQRLRGNFDESLQAFSAALALAEEVDYINGVGWSLWGLGVAYYSMGELDLAEEYLRSSLPIDQATGMVQGEVSTLRYLGNIQQARGDYAAALQFHRQAFELAAAPHEQALVQMLLAEDLAELGRHQDAELAALAALDLATGSSSDSLIADAWQQYARVQLHRGNADAATVAFDRALNLYASLGLHAEQARTLNGLALAARDLGDLRSAVRYGESSLAHIENLRGRVADPELRAFYTGARRGYYELQIELLMQLHYDSGALADQYLRAALAVSERGRARMMIDLLHEAAVELAEPTSNLRAREKELYAELARLRHQRDRLIEQSRLGSDVSESLSAVLRELAAVENELNLLEAQARAANPRSLNIATPSTLTAGAIQETLDAESALIQYALGAESSYVWVVTSESISAAVLPGRQRIEDLAIQVFSSLRDYQPSGDRQATLDAELAQLAELILEPISDSLARDRLLIAADGALQYIPFAVLPLRSANGSSQPLMLTHEVVGIPSASALVSLRTSRPGSVAARQIAVFADPVFEPWDSRLNGDVLLSSVLPDQPLLTRAAIRTANTLERLPMTALEASVISELVPEEERFVAVGFDASRDAVLNADLGNYRIVHFATHGFVDSRYPKLSALALSRFDRNGSPQEGFLELHDIYDLRLSADLIVLSACETALGREIRGEGLVGLTQGFLYAGARNVVATLWSVPDRATAELMSRFYRHLLTDGLRPPDALRLAQRQIAAERRWQDPYFWGGFVLIGDGS